MAAKYYLVGLTTMDLLVQTCEQCGPVIAGFGPQVAWVNDPQTMTATAKHTCECGKEFVWTYPMILKEEATCTT